MPVNIEVLRKRLLKCKPPSHYVLSHDERLAILGLIAEKGKAGVGTKELREVIKNRPDVIEPIPTLEGAMEYAKLVNKHLDKIDAAFADFLGNNVVASRNPLKEKYDWWKQHTELDKKSGYPISKEREELLLILASLLEKGEI